MDADVPPVVPVRVRAPHASAVTLVEVERDGHELARRPLVRDGDAFTGEVAAGSVYGLIAEGDGPRYDPTKVLLDPWATEVWFPPGHDRGLAEQAGVSNAGRGPVAVARRPPAARPSRRSSRPPVV